jgi:hypothetical protein
MPRRIQLRRTRGWRKPAGVVVVARPTRWGNPWKLGDPHPDPSEHGRPIADRAEAVALYQRDLEQGRLPVDEDTIRVELAGRDLACWCPLSDSDDDRLCCHGDLLLLIANKPIVGADGG